MSKNKNLIILSLIILLSVMNIQLVHSKGQYSLQAAPDLNSNRLIIGKDNLTFSQNELVFVYMEIENIGEDPLYEVKFNYSVNKELFTIESSSNTSSSSPQFVFYQWDTLKIGEKATFNITLKVSTNETIASAKLDAIKIDYLAGGELRIPRTHSVNELTIKIATNEGNQLQEKVLGFIELEAFFFLVVFLIPVILGVLLSFYFGLRQKRS